MINTHPALLPAFPGAHPVADTLAYGVKVTGATVHLVDDGVDTGPVLAQAAVEVRSGDTADEPARTHQDRGTAAARGHRRRAGPQRGDRDRTRGEHPVSELASEPSTRARAAAGAPGTGERLRQGGAHRAGRGAAQARRGDRLHRLDRAADRGRGRAGHRGRGADRLPRVPRRPGQDPAPARARRAARRHPPSRAPRAARRARHRPVRTARGEPLPVHRDGRLRRDAGRVRRADRHRRSRDGARERRRTTTAWPWSSIPSATTWVLDQVEAGGFTLDDRRRARRRGLPAHRHLRRRRRLLAGQRARPRRRRPVPGLGRGDLGARRDAALRREPAPGRGALHRGQGRAGRSGAVARQGDVVQQLRRRRRRVARRARPRRRADGRRDQAHQPVRDRDRHGRRRGAPQGARDGPGERVRRRDRDERRGQRGDGRAGRGGLHRGGRWRRRTHPKRWRS